MIGVFVRFRYTEDFDAAKLRNIAAGARGKFLGMPGLRSKAFTIDASNREAVNFYVWDSEDAAKAFFDDDMVNRIAGVYGVHPTVEFAEIATLVDNARL